MNARAAQSSEPEDRFVQLFAEAFGIERVQLLIPEISFTDILGQARFIDFGITTPTQRVAFEIDGLQHFQSLAQIEDDQLRQNSLIHQGWRVFRWTEHILKTQPERVKDDLWLFLSRIPGLAGQSDFLPKQHGSVIDLRTYQQEALRLLEEKRANGDTIALLTHATGTGKTVIALHDAQRLNLPTLYVAHRTNLVKQSAEKLSQIWPQARYEIYQGKAPDSQTQVLFASVQRLARHLDQFPADHFGYLIIDEAHHATANTYQRILGHFQAKFTLGLSATPERSDAQSILEIFQDTAHRLSLEEAVRIGALTPIRCIRVKTNVDLSKVRFNHIRYNARDLEQKIMVESRDELIVKTYRQHVSGKRAVVFAVNVRHAERLAELFQAQGIPAAAVSGGDATALREQRLRDFESGHLWVLCACDILNEGWDCPAVEVLFMARPTLSRIIYMQQLGRGTRRSPGKECLWVFDFVDNPSRYNTALSLHGVTKKGEYRPGALILAPDTEIEKERRDFIRQERPEALLHLALEVERMEEIDLFNWQEQVKDMLTAAEMEFKLAATEGTLRKALQRGEIQADHSIEIGDKIYYYFYPEHAETIRQTLGLPEINEHTLKDLFFAFVDKMDMSASYKPVFLSAFLETADKRGQASLATVTQAFKHFYTERAENGLPIDQPKSRISRLSELSDSDITAILISMPFRKFQQKHFFQHGRDLAYICVHRELWRQLDVNDIERLKEICTKSIEEYYNRLL